MYIFKFVKNCHYASKMLNIKIPLLNTKKNRALVLSSFSPTQLFATLWNVAHMAPLSMGFSRQEHWSGLPCPLPGDLPDPGIKPSSLMSPALADGFFTTNVTWEIEFKTKQSKYGLTKINTHLHVS